MGQFGHVNCTAVLHKNFIYCAMHKLTVYVVLGIYNFEFSIFSGGQQHEKFIEEALGRSSPGSARLLAELFGGFELGLEYRYSSTNMIFTNAISNKVKNI